ncbi:YozQ family protein [Peribacillus deserti]|uniref:DUF4025 domain-containing protein n=1 Tax=Peribacillus deserti TaxID=673318 RepID=A0A2N5MAN5_9BACI|nr:YozQ family protein [Peribacillus deserti]PLT31421.1 DUF4025 domain-containing protein [Peribacillus deserti]
MSENKTTAEKVAGKNYNPEKTENMDETTKGLAETHEQVNDYYVGKTVDSESENGSK